MPMRVIVQPKKDQGTRGAFAAKDVILEWFNTAGDTVSVDLLQAGDGTWRIDPETGELTPFSN